MAGAVALLAALAPAPAPARELVVHHQFGAGPALTAGGVGWTEDPGQRIAIRYAPTGRPARTLRRFGAEADLLFIVGAGPRLAYDLQHEGPDRPQTEAIHVGRPGGRFTAVHAPCGPSFPALSATALAFDFGGCPRPRSRAAVLDLRSGRRHVLPVGSEGPQLAGRYVAFARDGRIVVADWRTGAVAYTFAQPRDSTGVAEARWDVDARGRLAYTAAVPGRREVRPIRITLHSTADPSGRVLPWTARRLRIALAGGRLAFTRWTGEAARDPRSYEIDVVGLRGGAPRRVGTFRRSGNHVVRQLGELAFDGRRVAWFSTATRVDAEGEPVGRPTRRIHVAVAGHQRLTQA